MICTICQQDKLSNEFPPVSATEECNHFYCICLRCSVKSMQNGKCPYPECQAIVSSNSKRLKLFLVILNKKFPDLNPLKTTEDCNKEQHDVQTIILTKMNGESVNIDYQSGMSIKDLKALIHKKLKIEPTKQRLFYKNQGLLVYKNENYEEYTVDDYDIRPAATIYLIQIRFTISPRIEDLVYELEWGYPESENFFVKHFPEGYIKGWLERDIVDGTCIVCKKSEISGKVHSRGSDSFSGITHSGSQLTHKTRKGFQKIEVTMNDIDRDITSLFFILSARYAPNIHAYPNKRFKLFQRKCPEKGEEPEEPLYKSPEEGEEPLCNFGFDTERSFDKTDRTMAIIVCSVTKNKEDAWEIMEYGEPCEGKIDNFQLIEKRVKELLNKVFVK